MRKRGNDEEEGDFLHTDSNCNSVSHFIYFSLFINEIISSNVVTRYHLNLLLRSLNF